MGYLFWTPNFCLSHVPPLNVHTFQLDPLSPANAPHIQQLRMESSPILTPKIVYNELKRLTELNNHLEQIIEAQSEFTGFSLHCLSVTLLASLLFVRFLGVSERESLETMHQTLQMLKQQIQEERSKYTEALSQRLSQLEESCKKEVQQFKQQSVWPIPFLLLHIPLLRWTDRSNWKTKMLHSERS